MDPTVDVGPVIQRKEVDRIAEWVDEAVSQGAEVLTGGDGRRAVLPAHADLADVTPEMKVCREEVFGPVVTISPYQTFEEALAMVNDSKFGLQAGVFTNDINRAFEAHRTIEVGGVIVNDVSAFRADQMPYGGSKDSGFGREGLRFAMEEMTEPRIMVLSHVPAVGSAAVERRRLRRCRRGRRRSASPWCADWCSSWRVRSRGDDPPDPDRPPRPRQGYGRYRAEEASAPSTKSPTRAAASRSRRHR